MERIMKKQCQQCKFLGGGAPEHFFKFENPIFRPPIKRYEGKADEIEQPDELPW